MNRHQNSDTLKPIVTSWVVSLSLPRQTDFCNSDTPSSNSDQTWCRCVRLLYARGRLILIDEKAQNCTERKPLRLTRFPNKLHVDADSIAYHTTERTESALCKETLMASSRIFSQLTHCLGICHRLVLLEACHAQRRWLSIEADVRGVKDALKPP